MIPFGDNKETFQIERLNRQLQTQKKVNYTPEEKEKLRDASFSFEAILLNQLMKNMRNSLTEKDPEEDLMGDYTGASKMYKSMLDSEYVKIAARKGSLGIAEIIMKQLGLDNETESSETSVPVLNKMLVPPPQTNTSTLPTDGNISSSFGKRIHPLSGNMREHKGMDIASDIGTPVKASFAGRVIFSGEKSGYGKVVEVQHYGGWTTLYAHNSELLVKEGDLVQKGQSISRVGNTGNSTGPHLHFEMRKNGIAVDPKKYGIHD